MLFSKLPVSFCFLIGIAGLHFDASAEDAHLFILSGQSNMAGLQPAESFTPAVEKEYGKANVIVVHDAHGGQPIRRWYKNWKPHDGKIAKANGDLYDRLMKKVNSAIKGRRIDSVTLLWMQGERDAREKQGEVYAESLKGLVAQISTDLKREHVNFVIGRLSDFDLQNKRYPHWTKIREIQVEFAKKHPRTDWVNTDDLNDGLNRRGKEIKNDLHYSAEGYKTFGTRLAEKAIGLIGETPEGKNAVKALMLQSAVNGFQEVSLFQDIDLNVAKPDRMLEFKAVGKTKLKLHVFEPVNHVSTDAKPAIVFFFGGGWVGGSPSQFYKHSRYLSSRGMVAFCAEYRTRSKHKTTPVECVMDGKSAVRYIRSHARKLGVDPQRITAGGGSAGGHVAAATATLSQFDEPSDSLEISCRPDALVLFNPVYDNSEKGYGFDRVKDYWKDISPMHNLSKSTPPTVVFLGTVDKLIPVETARTFQKNMKKNGCRSELHLYEGQSHGFFNTGKPFVDTVEKMDRFLVSLGYLSGKPNIREIFPEGPQKKSGNPKKSQSKRKAVKGSTN
ncbi:MAG: sialate O-acetylesterase [Planctomycetota bacterium]|nr:sialate O-acetylesterase [Planctomycetota bacterium]